MQGGIAKTVLERKVFAHNARVGRSTRPCGTAGDSGDAADK